MEILVKESGRYVARKPQVRDGDAYVPLKRDDVFAIQLINRSRHEAAVKVFLDGLSLFSFVKSASGKAAEKEPMVLIPAQQSVLLRGWPITRVQSQAFKITEYAESAVGKLQVDAPIGVITAQFCASWPRNGSPPPDESNRAVRDKDRIGFGDFFDSRFPVMERSFGSMRASISVRYDR
jgi:hypothetical protein